MNKLDTFKYVFGPVPSRRLGRSLGVDLVPFKSCSFDCVYCQVGRTTDKTLERREFVPLDDVLAEVERKLAGDVFPDYITMSGSGEPTLYSRLGELIRGIKARAEVPVAVLTNGSLLSDPAVREELLAADLVVPSLDAGGEALYRRVNRPHIDATYEKLVEGLIAFREAYENALWLEVFLLGSITDDEARALAETASRVNPDRIQLNTVARPPAEADARAMPRDRMEALLPLFGEKAEIIADFSRAQACEAMTATSEEILAMLARRPCSAKDIADGLGISHNEALKHATALLAAGSISEERRGDTVYYVVGTRD